MINNPKADRRELIRAIEHLPVQVLFKENGGQGTDEGLGLTLSEGGMSIKLNKILGLPNLVHIRFSVPNSPKPLEFSARIVGQNQKDKIINTEFLDKSIEYSQKLGEYIHNLYIQGKSVTDRRKNLERRNSEIANNGINDIQSEKRDNRLERRKRSLYSQLAENGEFVLEKTVYLTDTNAFGNTYFARYFDWQGMAREAFVRAIIPNYSEFFQSGIKLITVEAQMTYKHESRVFDDVLVILKLGQIKRTTVELIFSFLHKHNKKLLGLGRQLIGFANFNGKITSVPKPLMDGFKPFMKKHHKHKSGAYIPKSFTK